MVSSAPVGIAQATARTYSPECIVALQSRDLQAFARLYDDYSGALFALIYRATGKTDSAERILQHTFGKVWLHLPDFNPEKSALYPWLMAIARNEIVDHYRNCHLKRTPLRNLLKTMPHLTAKF